MNDKRFHELHQTFDNVNVCRYLSKILEYNPEIFNFNSF